MASLPEASTHLIIERSHSGRATEVHAALHATAVIECARPRPTDLHNATFLVSVDECLTRRPSGRERKETFR